MIQKAFSVMIGLFFMCCSASDKEEALPSVKLPPFIKHFKVGYLPYQDSNRADIIFWCYYPGINIPSCCISAPFVGLGRVISTPLFIKHLEEFSKKFDYNDLKIMTEHALSQYLEKNCVEKRRIRADEKIRAHVACEVDIIKMFKEDSPDYSIPEDTLTLYKKISAGNEKISLKEYFQLMKKHMRDAEYEGSFICIVPKEAQGFCKKVEETMGGTPVKWMVVEKEDYSKEDCNKGNCYSLQD